MGPCVIFIPVTYNPPLLNVQSIHANVQKYECLSNKGQCCEGVPALWLKMYSDKK